MSAVFSQMERAHKLAAQAVGLLSNALTQKKINRATAERCVRQWREAADILEKRLVEERK